MELNKARYRWKVEITLVDGSSEGVYIQEIRDLHDVIEGGPDWRLIDHIHITYNGVKDV